MMGTRSGDLDPALPGFLARMEGVEIAEVETWLNTRSGLLGVSERSSDMRKLLEAAGQGDAGAELALAMFCYRVRKYIASYLAVLNGADAILFGGGIGENAPEVRARICAQMDWCGLRPDTARNTAARGTPARISTDDAALHAYVMPVDEARIIARDTVHCLGA
jgi:acetate kinase